MPEEEHGIPLLQRLKKLRTGYRNTPIFSNIFWKKQPLVEKSRILIPAS
jgi:hypothetical protein